MAGPSDRLRDGECAGLSTHRPVAQREQPCGRRRARAAGQGGGATAAAEPGAQGASRALSAVRQRARMQRAAGSQRHRHLHGAPQGDTASLRARARGGALYPCAGQVAGRPAICHRPGRGRGSRDGAARAQQRRSRAAAALPRAVGGPRVQLRPARRRATDRGRRRRRRPRRQPGRRRARPSQRRRGGGSGRRQRGAAAGGDPAPRGRRAAPHTPRGRRGVVRAGRDDLRGDLRGAVGRDRAAAERRAAGQRAAAAPALARRRQRRRRARVGGPPSPPRPRPPALAPRPRPRPSLPPSPSSPSHLATRLPPRSWAPTWG